jgi:hypothetical protein
MRVVVPPWLKSLAYLNVLCTANFTNTNCMNITREYLDEMWERIEDMEKRLVADPNNRGLAMILHGTIDSYNAKLQLFEEQEWKAGR